LLSLPELQERLDAEVERSYNCKIHSALGQSPVARYADRSTPRCEPSFATPMDLLVLRPHVERKVRRDGVEFDGRMYWGPGLEQMHVGALVVVFYDRRDLATVVLAAATPSGPPYYLGVATCDRVPDPARQRALGEAITTARPCEATPVPKLLSAPLTADVSDEDPDLVDPMHHG
jgi:hypothetical protein